ncbi:hypothetical protein Riv7116_6876 [Rivularia sp. PCC 7116]|uniref:hypothetical protein n=1 Tax=Rivularia sp. PCC 7116 TaxID=373994 RepID=UPI00029EFD5C|nr:hypothetical protein [Rivularia sp. PCC 7116]AFY59190.1 hypothetical protein Riv7116_6876 [Rivularia sp. PCC 7116]
MNKSIYFGLLATSIGLIPLICHQKVMGKPELISDSNNQLNTSASSGFGYIQTRNRKIKINENKTYTIYSQDGKVLAENMTLEKLQAQKPELHEMIKESIAKPTLMMDASIGIGK